MSPGRRFLEWFREHVVLLLGLLVLLYMVVPVLVVMLMSFNEGGRRGYEFRGFTLDNWDEPVRAQRHLFLRGAEHRDRASSRPSWRPRSGR